MSTIPTVAEAEAARFSVTVKDQPSLDISGKLLNRALLERCRIARFRGAMLKDCVLRDCEIDPVDVRDLIGLTVTLGCSTFNRTKVSPLAMDALIYLISKGADAAEKKRVRAVIPPERVALFDRLFPQLDVSPVERFR